MNVYQKLNFCRMELQNMSLKKSGANKFAGFDYFELSDFLPEINSIFDRQGLCSVVSFGTDVATMTITNTDEPTEQIVLTSPMGSAALKACHEIQNIGACETYCRRYLYMSALEIVEHDQLDGTIGKDKPASRPKPKPRPAPAAPNDSGEVEYIDIFEDEATKINANQIGLLQKKFGDRGIDVKEWKRLTGISSMKLLSWKCLNDFNNKQGILKGIDSGRWDSLIQGSASAGKEEEIDLEADDPWPTEGDQ